MYNYVIHVQYTVHVKGQGPDIIIIFLSRSVSAQGQGKLAVFLLLDNLLDLSLDDNQWQCCQFQTLSSGQHHAGLLRGTSLMASLQTTMLFLPPVRAPHTASPRPPEQKKRSIVANYVPS